MRISSDGWGSGEDFGSLHDAIGSKSSLGAHDGFVGLTADSASLTSTPGPLFAGDDIADNTTTTTTLTVGNTLNSALTGTSDLDYIRVTLVEGQTYTFSMVGTTDAYLELRNSAGTLIAENDDGGIVRDSFLMFRATTSGTYYVVARGWGATDTGNYSLGFNSIAQGNTSPTTFPGNGLPIYSWDEAAIQISRLGASWSTAFGTGATIFYSYRSSAPTTMPDGTSGFSRFSTTQINATEAALAAWASVANITFVRVNDGDGFSNNGGIVFGNYLTGSDGAAAFAYQPTNGGSGDAREGDVWVNVSLSYNANPVVGEYGQQVLLHEIGHALGLSHPADYNAGSGVTIDYSTHAIFYNDSRMFTTMSYFSPLNTGGNSAPYASLPQLDDIAAIQRLYGANGNTRTGDTVYGFNSNTGLAQYSLASATTAAVFAIWDGGGNDTLDLSGFTTNSIIDLRPEAYSNAGPSANGSGTAANFNISIARGVTIENAIGGSGDDTITGNSANNNLTGGFGSDTINGGGGIDRAMLTGLSTESSWIRLPDGRWVVNGGQGQDYLTSVEVLHFTNRDVVLDNAQQTFSGDGTSDILWRRTDGLTATWTMQGANNTGSAVVGNVGTDWSIRGTGDFSGDGRDDILWQRNDGLVYTWNNASSGSAVFVAAASTDWSIAGIGDFNFDGRDDFLWRNPTSGQVAIWTMNGATVSNQAVVGGAGLEWGIQAVADFTGDGRDDILWRRDDGLVAIWQTNGSAVTGSTVLSSVGAEWSVAGAGDFNGDGYADILWQRNDGLMAIWEMNGAGVLASATIGGVGTTWHVADIGDYNGDGRDDIFWRSDSGLLAVWTMNGFTVTGTGTSGSVGAEWGII